MQQLQIPVDCLVMERPDQSKSAAKFCAELARSIAHDGLLQPPVVQPDLTRPGLYRVIAGRKRIWAMSEELGWPVIPCSVVEGLDAEMTESAQIAENLFREELPEAQRLLAIQRWKDIYERHHPLSTATGRKDRILATEVRRRADEAEAAGQQVNEKEIEAEVAAEAKPFTEVVMNTLGVSRATAPRMATTGNSVTRLEVGQAKTRPRVVTH
jgi:ParB/RepB/Spo0J family partition protein